MKQVGYYHVFPFQEVEKGASIVIWGMGEVGQHYVKQLRQTGYCKVSYAVDNRWQQMKKEIVPVYHPSHIKNTPGEIVVIANGDGSQANKIRATLKEWGLPDERILWKDYIVGQSMVVEGEVFTPPSTVPRHDSVGLSVRPYIDGSESMRNKRRTPYSISREFFRGGRYFFDVVAFDVFGTSVFFPFMEEGDLFHLLERENGIEDFARIRKEAEEKARKIKGITQGNEEASLEEIYRVLQGAIGLDTEEGMGREENMLLEYCFANSYIHDAYSLFRNKGRKIIFVSDSCYSKDFIGRLLQNCGYDVWDEIFVASEFYGCSKHSGKMYQAIRRTYGTQRNYFMIGDNGVVDSKVPRENGFQQASTFVNVNALGNPYRAAGNGMSKLVGSLYGGLVNIQLYRGNDGESYSVPYEFGFVYGGIYVLGMIQWLEAELRRKGVDRVLFLSDAGDMYLRVYEMLSPEIPGKHVHWSDVLTVKLRAILHGYPFVRQFLESLLRRRHPPRQESVLEAFSLDSMEKQMAPYMLREKGMPYDVFIRRLEAFLLDHWRDILKIFQQEADAAGEYVRAYTGNGKRIALVDLGMGMSAAAVWKKMAGHWGIDAKLLRFSAGSFEEETSEERAFLFSRNREQAHYNHYRREKGGRNDEHFRCLTASMEPAMTGFVRDRTGILRLKFSSGKSYENMPREAVLDIRRGIMDFARLWMEHSGKKALSISASDAYIPFQTISPFMDWLYEGSGM